MKHTLIILVVAAAVAGIPACGREESQGGDVLKAMEKETLKLRQGGWHGTVTVIDKASGVVPDPGNHEFSQAETTTGVLNRVNIGLNSPATAKVTFTLDSGTPFRALYDSYKLSGTITENTTAAGMSDSAEINIEVYADGTYALTFFASGVKGTYKMMRTTTVTCKPNVDPECKNRTDVENEEAEVWDLGGASGGVRGRIDKKNPNQISGTESSEFKYAENVVGTTVTSWSLVRSQ